MDHNVAHQVLLSAFRNQDELNKRLDANWVKRGFPYYRAVWTELGEAMQHTNWLWWKTKEYGQPLSQVQIGDVHVELCDVLHFGISMDIIEARNSTQSPEDVIDYFCRTYQQWFNFVQATPPVFDYAIERMVVSAITKKQFDIEAFAEACASVELTLGKLMVLYFGKATLNKFRWDHGYSLPTGDPNKYVKMWPSPDPEAFDKVEDNVILYRLIQQLVAANSEDDILQAIADGSFQPALYKRLARWYTAV